jgi:hypothetical protein
MAVRDRFEAAGMATEFKDNDHLEIATAKEPLIVRVMRDPGHPDRVHLRSVTSAGEVTISTQRMNKLKLLVDYAKVLVAAAARKP